jgi:hypothetical protein
MNDGSGFCWRNGDESSFRRGADETARFSQIDLKKPVRVKGSPLK